MTEPKFAKGQTVWYLEHVGLCTTFDLRRVVVEDIRLEPGDEVVKAKYVYTLRPEQRPALLLDGAYEHELSVDPEVLFDSARNQFDEWIKHTEQRKAWALEYLREQIERDR